MDNEMNEEKVGQSKARLISLQNIPSPHLQCHAEHLLLGMNAKSDSRYSSMLLQARLRAKPYKYKVTRGKK
jgi:hypothetical protein